MIKRGKIEFLSNQDEWNDCFIEFFNHLDNVDISVSNMKTVRDCDISNFDLNETCGKRARQARDSVLPKYSSHQNLLSWKLSQALWMKNRSGSITEKIHLVQIKWSKCLRGSTAVLPRIDHTRYKRSEKIKTRRKVTNSTDVSWLILCQYVPVFILTLGSPSLYVCFSSPFSRSKQAVSKTFSNELICFVSKSFPKWCHYLALSISLVLTRQKSH